jgi:hypothetical protein
VEEGHKGGPGAKLVVDAAGKDELFVETADGSGLRIVKLKFPVENGGIVGD